MKIPPNLFIRYACGPTGIMWFFSWCVKRPSCLPGRRMGLCTQYGVIDMLRRETVILATLSVLMMLASPAAATGGNSYAPITEWGSEGSGNGQFIYPFGIASDRSGNIYITDSGNNRIQVFTGTGEFVRALGMKGTGDGEFRDPRGVAVDGNGSVYVADCKNNRIQKFTGTGTYCCEWGSSGTGDGEFSGPHGVAVDGSGTVYVVDTGNNRIQAFTDSGDFKRAWGSMGRGDGQFQFPLSIAVDDDGAVYVADSSNFRIQKFSATGVFLMKWEFLDEEIFHPYGIAVDRRGNVYLADHNHDQIRTFSSSGEPLTRWGSFGSGIGQFNKPSGITIDAAGNAYVVDEQNHRIQKFEPVTLAADFSTDKKSGAAPLTVTFTDTSAGSPTSWAWGFGDGGTSDRQNPVHTYVSPGNYTVTLSINGGLSNTTKPNYIKVTPVLFGDANGDGQVNQADTLLVLRQVVGIADPDEMPNPGTDDFRKTDVNQNGMIDVGDALFIAQYNVGLRDVWFELI